MGTKIIMTSAWKNTEVCNNCGNVNDYFFDAPSPLCDSIGRPLDRGEDWSLHRPCPNCGKKDSKEKVVRVVYIMKGKRKWLFWREKHFSRYFEEMTDDGPRVLPKGPYKKEAP